MLQLQETKVPLIFFLNIVKLDTQPGASESASSSNMEIVTSSNGTWPNAGADIFRTSSQLSWMHNGVGLLWSSLSPSSCPGLCSPSSGG
ncbi:unnamed protein product [Leptidea sinapis]|uniref:Uncharacterized protein n=1 Tax=Leptidea sinapis TaxID=189913 RepID=A0A5E4Q4D2_9NEOP|nr:unnamed protein product [Leptidea sinapis]